MITKEEFIDLISKQQEWSNRIDQISKILDAPAFFENDWVEYTSILFDKTLNLLFTEEGVDDINWWMYEKSGNPEFKMWDENNNEIPIETIDNLWDIVKEYRK